MNIFSSSKLLIIDDIKRTKNFDKYIYTYLYYIDIYINVWNVQAM